MHTGPSPCHPLSDDMFTANRKPERKSIMNIDDKNAQFGCLAIIVALVLLLIPFLMWAIPVYNVWKNKLQGEAELARAEQNRQIKIEEAKANLEAEKLNAEAEVERAKGASRAIEIENGKLTDRYIKYLAVRTFNTDNAKFVYIPTECGIVPWLLESGRGPKIEEFPNNIIQMPEAVPVNELHAEGRPARSNK